MAQTRPTVRKRTMGLNMDLIAKLIVDSLGPRSSLVVEKIILVGILVAFLCLWMITP